LITKALFITHELLTANTRSSNINTQTIETTHTQQTKLPLEQYTKYIKKTNQKILKMSYTLLRTHRLNDPANRSYGLKETTTETFILHKGKGLCTLFILIEQDHIKSYLDQIR